MTTFEFNSCCPSCGKENAQITNADGQVCRPQSGDFVICFGCQEVTRIARAGNNYTLKIFNPRDIGSVPREMRGAIREALAAVRRARRCAGKD